MKGRDAMTIPSWMAELEDEDLQKEFFSEGLQASFDNFKKYYTFGSNSELDCFQQC